MTQVNRQLYDGSLFTGVLKCMDGRFPVGEGTIQYPNGYRFEGTCGPDLAINWGQSCVGTVRDPQDVILSGYHIDVQYLNWRYSGDFTAGKREGFGIMTRIDNIKYEGQFTEDVPNGPILSTATNGSKQKFNFQMGSFTDHKIITPQFLNAHAALKAQAERKRELISLTEQIKSKRKDNQHIEHLRCMTIIQNISQQLEAKSKVAAFADLMATLLQLVEIKI